MKTFVVCSHCKNGHFITIKERITFISNEKTHEAIATRLDDCFYEIVEGEFEGNLVHIFDVLTSKIISRH